MKQNKESQQWDDLLEQAFGSEKAAETGFSAPLQTTPTNSPQTAASPRPFYRRRRFWLAAVAVFLVLGGIIWLFADKSGSETPTVPSGETTPLPEDMTLLEGLAQCKAALAQWQEMTTYHIHQSYLHYGDTMGGYSESDFWKSGEDFLFAGVLPDLLSSSYTVGHLKQNGTYYAGSVNNERGSPYPSWQVNNSGEYQEAELLPWPMIFDWETNRITIIDGDFLPDGRVSTMSFAVVEGNDHFISKGPYHVQFALTLKQELESITVIFTSPGQGSQAASTVITYRMGTESTAEIEMKVGNALRMPLTTPEMTDEDILPDGPTPRDDP